MPPKASRATAGHDDSESKPTNAKEKNGHGHTNGKMRRVASQTGSNLKDVTNAANLPSPAAEATTTSAPVANPSVSLPFCLVPKGLPTTYPPPLSNTTVC